MPAEARPKRLEAIAKAKAAGGKRQQRKKFGHTIASLKSWRTNEKRTEQRHKQKEKEEDRDTLNMKLDKQMTDVYKRVEALDSENWSKKEKKDRWEAEFVRLGGIPLKRNKCSFAKHLERVRTKKQEDKQKVELEEASGVYDLVEGSKVKERRRKAQLQRDDMVRHRRRMATKLGYIHATSIGRVRSRGGAEIRLDPRKMKQAEIRKLKRDKEGQVKQSRSGRSIWDDRYDINKYHDPRALNSGRLDQFGAFGGGGGGPNRRGGRQKQKGGKRRRR